MRTAGQFLFRKIAQDSQGVGDLANVASSGATRAAMLRNPLAYGNPADSAGSTSGAQLLSAGATSAFGDIGGAAVQSFLPFLIPMLRGKGVDLQSMYELYPQGSAANRQTNLQKMRATQGILFENNGEAVKQVAVGSTQKLLELMRKLAPAGMIPATAEQDMARFINSASPQTLGMGLQMIDAAFPGAGDIMDSFGPPGFIRDPTPLANAMLARNKGVWNDNDFQSMYTQYKDAYKSGQFAGVPGRFAISAIQHAAENGATDPIAAGAKLNAAARAFQESGAAPEYGDALQMVTQIDPNAVNDPTRAVGYAKWIAQNSGQGYIDPQNYAAAAQLARERGIPLAAAMATVARGRTITDNFRSNPAIAQQVNQDVAGAYSRGVMSPTLKLLQSAMNTDDRLGVQISAALKSGDGATLHAIAQRAAKNPEIRRNARGADPSALIQQMDPDAYNTVMQQDAVGFAKRTGNRELGKLFQNQPRLNLALQGNWKGLSHDTIKFLQSNPGRSAMSSAVVGGFKPSRAPIDTSTTTSPPVGKRPLFGYPGAAPTPPVKP